MVQTFLENKGMGKGDKRTRRGKLFNRSYGKSRPHDKKAGAANTKKTYPKKSPAVKTAAKSAVKSAPKSATKSPAAKTAAVKPAAAK